jgi:hypothetical protein
MCGRTSSAIQSILREQLEDLPVPVPELLQEHDRVMVS